MDISLSNVLAILSFTMLVLVTGGISYLTVAEWRDRRRREQDQRNAKRR